MKYKIEKNVPIPEIGRGRGRCKGVKTIRVYPFNEMKIGDSFVFDLKDRQRVSSNYSAYQRNHYGFYFSCRGNRVWRVTKEYKEENTL